jgi:Predicted integral membrane protein
VNSAPVFHPYGTAHLVVILLTILLPFAMAGVVRATGSVAVERALTGILSTLLVLNYVAYLVLITHFGGVTWAKTLPMQLCDWAMLVIIVAMVTGNRSWFEVAYFWGIGGTLQAVLTPNLAYGFPDFRFFSFFISHCGIIIGVVFLMLTRNYRPYPFSIVKAFLWSELYFVVTLIVDKITGYNYGFLLHKPEAFSILSFLSDSHLLYLVQFHLLALLFFAMLYVPFVLYDLIWGRRSVTALSRGQRRISRPV